MEIHEKCFTELISQHNKYLLLQPHYFTNEKKKTDTNVCRFFFPLEHFSSLLIFLIFSLFNICFTGKFLPIIYHNMLILYFFNNVLDYWFFSVYFVYVYSGNNHSLVFLRIPSGESSPGDDYYGMSNNGSYYSLSMQICFL